MSEQSQVDLVVTGMTCASCAQRIERKLNKLDGVEASVNYATGLAHVVYAPSLVVDQLVATVQAAGYDAIPPNPLLDEQVAAWEAAHERDLALRWRIGALLAAPTVLIAMLPALHFAGWTWATVALATPVVTWAAWPLHIASFRNARHRSTTMDTLVSIGIIAAFVGSIYQLLTAGGHHEPHIYIDVAVVVPVFVLLGRWLEARNKRQAGSALRALADATPKSAIVLRDGLRNTVAIEHISIGDMVVVPAESTVPVDGIVEAGASNVSTALLTGESMPRRVGIGDKIAAGAVNFEGELQVRVTAIGAGSQIARIASLVAAAQSGKANISRLADRISAVFVPAVLTLTVMTGVVWATAIDANRAIDVMLAVLVIACPCALGLATPTALVVGSGRAATLGILIAGPEVFESSHSLDAIVFDKTGTLTLGEMTATTNSVPAEYLGVLKALAEASRHPVSVATAASIATEAVQLNNVTTIAGKGVRGEWDGHSVEFGNASFGDDASTTLAESGTESWLFVDGHIVGGVQVNDRIDPTAAETIARLDALGISPVMATGDKPAPAHSIAAQLGITDVRAGLMPSDKLTLIDTLQEEGKHVAMVGDGSNDAPALAKADIGIAMGRGTGVARATADITLLRPDLRLIPTALSLSQKTLRTIKQNLAWAFGYNIAAIPLAMSGQLNPMIAGIAMSASSVLVVTNSLRLARVKL